MDRFVSLEHLPPGVNFPVELQSRVWFDADRRRLYFRGFMSKSDFDRLCRTHNDFHFQRALEALFQKCTFDDPTPATSPWLHVRGMAATALALALASAAAVGLLWVRH